MCQFSEFIHFSINIPDMFMHIKMEVNFYNYKYCKLLGNFLYLAYIFQQQKSLYLQQVSGLKMIMLLFKFSPRIVFRVTMYCFC